jgi:hypothetical protein
VAKVNESGLPLGLAAGGVAAFLLGWAVHSRLLRLLGFGVAATGGVLYARERLAERAEKIDEAEGAVRSALDDLDPVARAQVLMDVARSKD